jgi:hypothetical protein
MKIMKFFIFYIIIFSTHALAESILQRKYPYGLLTDDFGILKENDLLADTVTATPTPYKINEFQPAFRRWQCFPTKDVSFEYETWKANDPMGSESIIVDLCVFSIEVKNTRPTHSYGGRRAYRLAFCKKLQKSWNRLTKNESYVCLNGHPEHYKHNKKNWTWEQFKTSKGCESYFQRSCRL